MTLTTQRVLDLAWTQCWQVAILAVAVGAIVALACRRRPHVAYLLWMLVVVKALTPPLVPSPTGVFSWALAERQVAPAPSSQKFNFTGFATIESAANTPETRPTKNDGTRAQFPSELPVAKLSTIEHVTYRQVLLALWGTGVVILSGYTLTRWLLLMRVLRTTRQPISDDLRDHFVEIARELGLRRRPHLVVTSRPLGPAAFGWWPGTVILPQSLVAAKSLAELSPIVAHELVHLRRFDTLAGSLQLAAQLVWWFHPAVWWANRQARVERERACDEEVLATLAFPPTDYARMLVEILAWRNQLPIALPWPAMRSRDVTKRRLDHILRTPGAFRRRASWSSWGVALLVALAVLPGAALHLVAEAQNTDSASLQNQNAHAATPDSASEPPPAAAQADFQMQQQYVAELKKLGVNVQQQWYPFPHPRTVLRITLPPSWQPGDQPLPLDRLGSEASVSVGGMAPETPPDEARLRAQLLTLKQLPASATLIVYYTADNAGALEVLKQLPALEKLSVGPYVDYTKVNPAAKATPATFGLETLTRLRSLTITAAPSDLARVAALTNLETLGLGGEFPGAELDKLASLANLRELGLSGGPAGPLEHISLACLDGMTSLETLNCSDRCRIDDAAAGHIGANPSLKRITLHLDHLTDEGLRQLAQSKELRWLSGYDSANTGKITAAGLAQLGALNKLQSLQFTAFALPDKTPLTITDEAVADWSTLGDLRSLRIQPCNLSDAALRTIGQLSHLEALELIGDNTVTDAGLQPLSGLANLQAFVMHTSRLNGPGLEALSGLRRLQLLAVPDAPIDDRGLNTIAQMKGLKALDLSHTAITDAGLQALRDKLADLELLNLAGTKVTDQGLNVLLNCPKLQQINAIDTGMSIALLKKLLESGELVRVWVLDPDTVQSQGNRFQAFWQPISVDTLGELTSRLWQLTSATKEVQDNRADSDKQSSKINGTFLPAGVAATRFTPPPEPTAEQQATIDKLKNLGFVISPIENQNSKLRFVASFNSEFRPLSEPLPLADFPMLDQISIRARKDHDDLSAQLSALRNLQPETTLHVDLRASDGAAFNRLADIPGLTRLMLTGVLPPLEPGDRTVRLDQLSNLKHLTCFFTDAADAPDELRGATKLEELVLNGNHTDAQLTPLANLTSLKSLSLSAGMAEPLDLPWVARLANLEVLHVGQPISDLAMQQIERVSKLKGLLVDSTFLTDSGIKRIGHLPKLEVLYLFGHLSSQVTAQGLMELALLPELRSLNLLSHGDSGDLESCYVTDEVLLRWSALSKLRVLQINCCQLSPRGAAALAEFRDLRSLALHGTTGLTDAMPQLSRHLRELSLTIPRLTDRGMSQFGNLIQLESLLLKDAHGITDAGLAELEPLAALTSLTISHADLSAPGIASLAKLPRLAELRMSECTVADSALDELTTLNHLKTLSLSNCGITDQQVKAIAGLTTLRELDLGINPITDIALPSLGDLKQLSRISLYETKTTEAGRKRLAQELPSASIDANNFSGWAQFSARKDYLDD